VLEPSFLHPISDAESILKISDFDVGNGDGTSGIQDVGVAEVQSSSCTRGRIVKFQGFFFWSFGENRKEVDCGFCCKLLSLLVATISMQDYVTSLDSSSFCN